MCVGEESRYGLRDAAAELTRWRSMIAAQCMAGSPRPCDTAAPPPFMRILHVSSWFQPELGYSEYHLPTAQQRLGHIVAVLTSDRFFPFPNYDATVGPVLGARVVGRGRRTEHGLSTYRLPVAFEYRHHLWLREFDAAVREFP